MMSIECMTCKHMHTGGASIKMTCDAFKDGIPAVIYTGKLSHKKPYPGDGGIQYESIDGVDYSDEADDDND